MMSVRQWLLPVLAIAVTAVPVDAQVGGTTKEQIDRAKAFYETYNVEAARPILLNIISPNYLQQISPAERVEVYKYLGASYALLDKLDSAVTFFIAALDFDPFTDLDPSKFSATEIGPFNTAKASIFKVGLRPIEQWVIDPNADTTAYNFRVITTSRAVLNVELVRQDNNEVTSLYSGESQGLRTIPWRGVLANGEFADSTTYVIRARARPPNSNADQTITTQHFLRVEHAYAPLDDTLPPFTLADGDLLQSEYPVRAPWMDLVKGVVVAAIAVGIPTVALTPDLSDRQTHALVAGAIGAAVGTGSFLFRRQNRSIPENVRENERRRQEREAFNNRIRQANAEKLRQRKLIITPVVGVGG